MRNWIVSLVMVCAALGPAVAAADRVMMEGILARVNDRIVTISDFVERIRVELVQMPSPPPPDERNQFIRMVLDEMVNELILLERATEKRLEVNDEMVTNSINGLREENNLQDDEAWAQALESSGLTEEILRERYRRNMMLQQAVQGDAFGFTRLGAALDSRVPGCLIAFVLQLVKHALNPSSSVLVVFLEQFATCVVNVLGKVIEVQTDMFHDSVQFQLRPDPRRAVDVGDPFIRLGQIDEFGIASHQSACDFMVTSRDRHVLVRLRFIIMSHHAKLLPGPIRSLLGPGKRFALAVSRASLLTNLLPSRLLLRVGDQGDLHTVATRVDPCFPGIRDTILRVPRRRELALRLCLTNRPTFALDQLANRLRIAFNLRGTLQVFRGLAKAGRRLIQTAGQFSHASTDGRLRFIQEDVSKRRRAFLSAIPTSPPETNLAIDRQDRVRLLTLVVFPLPRRFADRRGEKRLPPHPPSTASPSQTPSA